MAGKAAESLNRGTSTSAAYSFLKNTHKTDYKIADAFAEKIYSDPPMKTLLFWIENFAKIFEKNAKAPIFFNFFCHEVIINLTEMIECFKEAVKVLKENKKLHAALNEKLVKQKFITASEIFKLTKLI